MTADGEIAMKGRDDSGGGGVPQDGDPTWPALDAMQDGESSEDMISPAQLIRYLGQASRPVERADEPEDGDDTNRLPRITRMPEGIKVEEHRVGRAVAQWVLHVRCDCGRRWFEVEAVDTTSCPRCGMLVYVDVDARSARK
jgi:hypothetical protein